MDLLIKDKRSLLFEILFGLEGIGGDLYCLNVNNDKSDGNCLKCDVLRFNNSSLNQLLTLNEINLINELLIIANHYLRINHFIQKYKSDINLYKRRLSEGFEQILIGYRNDLIEVEKEIIKDPKYSLIKFNKFLKYLQTFEFLNQIITQTIKEKVSICSTLDLLNSYSLSGWTRIQSSAKIAHKSCCDIIFDDIWLWIIFGFLREKSQNDFFITEDQNKVSKIEICRVPDFIDPIDATKVYYIGETVRSAQRRGVRFIYKGKETELYDLYSKIKPKLSSDRLLFSGFIEKVRSFVSEHNWNYIVNEQNLRDHLLVIKNFYLTANDNLWSSFVFHKSKIILNGQKRFQKDIESSFESSLRQVLCENSVYDMLSAFTITATRDNENSLISLNYKIPLSLQYIVSTDSFNKYNNVLNFMLNIYSARFDLNQIWFKSMKPKVNSNKASVNQILIWNLRNSLTNVIENLYYYLKVDVIERLFLNLMKKIEEIKDIEVIEKEHQIFLTSIIAQSFLKTSAIKKCLNDLFSICHRFEACLQSNDSLEQLIKDFNLTTAHLYHLLANIETRKLNPMIANLVSQLKLCSKHSTHY